MNRRSDSVGLAEQRVAEARNAALAEYRAAREKLHRRMGSPLFIGGVLIGGVALVYLALGRGKPRRVVDPGSPRAWSQAVKAVQVLLPLLLALGSAAARRPDAKVGRTAR